MRRFGFEWVRLMGVAKVSATAAVVAVLSLSIVSPAVADDPDTVLYERLASTRVDVNYAPEDLVRVVEDLRTRHELNVQVAWSVLDQLGIRKDHRVEIRLADVPLATLLDNLVREVDPTGGRELAWGIDGGVVVISTQSAIGRRTILRAYDIRDLLGSGYGIRRFASTPALTLQATGLEHVGGEEREVSGGGGGGFGGGGGGGTGGGIFGSPGSDMADRMERVQGLMDLIENQVDPMSWLDGAYISHLDGTLLVRNTLRAHQGVAALFELLRNNRATAIVLDVAFVRLSTTRAAEARQASGDVFPLLPQGWFDEILRTGDADGVIYRGAHPGRSGEAVWVTDIGQLRLVEGVTALVADNAVALTPRLGVVHDGLELIALPMLVPGSERLELDVQMALKPTANYSLRPDDGGRPGVDVGRERMRTVSGRLALGLGDAVAFSVPSAPSSDGASIRHEEWLILRVRRFGG